LFRPQKIQKAALKKKTDYLWEYCFMLGFIFFAIHEAVFYSLTIFRNQANTLFARRIRDSIKEPSNIDDVDIGQEKRTTKLKGISYQYHKKRNLAMLPLK